MDTKLNKGKNLGCQIYGLRIVLKILFCVMIVFAVFGIIIVPEWNILILKVMLVELIMMFVCKSFIVYIHKCIARITEVECDPYQSKEAYEYLRSHVKRQKEKNVYSLLIAQCLYFEGYAENAYAVIKTVDFTGVAKRYFILYCNVMRLYYGKTGDYENLMRIRQTLIDRMKKSQIASANRKKISDIVQVIDATLIIEKGDEVAFQQFINKMKQRRMNKIQEVSLHYMMAKMACKMNNVEEVRFHCQFVIENGNLLYYVGEAKKILIEIEEGVLPHPVEECHVHEKWDMEQMYKPQIGQQYFIGRKTYIEGKRKKYLCLAGFIFAISACIYGFLGNMLWQTMIELETVNAITIGASYSNRWKMIIQCAIGGGMMVAGTFSGIRNYLLIMDLKTRIAMVWQIVILVVAILPISWLGIVTFIPYYIYSLIRYIHGYSKNRAE